MGGAPGGIKRTQELVLEGAEGTPTGGDSLSHANRRVRVGGRGCSWREWQPRSAKALALILPNSKKGQRWGLL